MLSLTVRVREEYTADFYALKEQLFSKRYEHWNKKEIRDSVVRGFFCFKLWSKKKHESEDAAYYVSTAIDEINAELGGKADIAIHSYARGGPWTQNM